MSVVLLMQIVAITHATLIDPGTAMVRPDVTIVVDGSRISQVANAKSVRVPAGARVIDAHGKFVIPGLWDMHVHLTVPGGRALLGLYVANGVTGVRAMNDELSTLRSWQREVSAGTLDGPRMFMSGPYLIGANFPTPHLEVHTAADGVRAVDSLVALNVDFIKVHNGLNAESYFAIARTARLRGKVFAGHVSAPVTPTQAADSGQRSLEHLSGFPNECTGDDSMVIAGASRLARILMGSCVAASQEVVYRHIAGTGAWVTPTLIVQTEVVAGRKDVAIPADTLRRFISASLRELWGMMAPLPTTATTAEVQGAERLFAKRVALTGALHRAGVPLLAGTDAPLRPSTPGFGLHDELALMVRAGLTPMEALRTATSSPASYFAVDSIGAIAPGKVADLVVLDADPRADIANSRRIFAVLANGRVYDAAARQAVLQRAERAARANTP